MNKKNRRIPVSSPFQNICLQQIPCVDKRPLSLSDKQNEAKLALLDMGNDDSMFNADVILGQQNPTRNSLIERMKGYEAQQMAKTAKRGVVSVGELNALLPRDNNRGIDRNSFVEDKPLQTPGKKQTFSMRNTPFLKSKENLFPFSKKNQGKKDQQNFFKLKKILKKLESPQKSKVDDEQGDKQSKSKEIKKRKTNANRITQFCTEFMHQNVSAFKQRKQLEFGSHQKALQSQNQAFQSQKFYEFRTGSKTSHQRHRSSFTRVPISGTSTPTKFFYKPSKLTNRSTLFKRNSIMTGELISQKSNHQGFRKTSARMVQQVSRANIERNQIEDIYLQQEKIKEERKSRNLKNILFD